MDIDKPILVDVLDQLHTCILNYKTNMFIPQSIKIFWAHAQPFRDSKVKNDPNLFQLLSFKMHKPACLQHISIISLFWAHAQTQRSKMTQTHSSCSPYRFTKPVANYAYNNIFCRVHAQSFRFIAAGQSDPNPLKLCLSFYYSMQYVRS